MSEGEKEPSVRLENANGRHSSELTVGGGGGDGSGFANVGHASIDPRPFGSASDLPLLSVRPQPLRMLPGRRPAAGSHSADGQPSSPVVLQQVLQQEQQQQYHPHLLKEQQQSGWRFGGVQPQHGGAQQAGGDVEAGAAARRPATPREPASPATLRRDGRLALLSMLLLVFQGTALSIMLRYSRARAGTPYLASVSVILTELIKLLICLVMHFRAVRAEVAAAAAGGGGATTSAAAAAAQAAALSRELRRSGRELAAQSLPMLLPAAMFVGQQVLLIVAATHLDAVAFQIFNQSFKLVPTALFAYWLLGQALEPMQWASIPVLAAGVVLVTVNNGAASSTAGGGAAGSSSGLDYVAGMVACSVSGLSSAYAGVYFEKYVKGRHAASLWVRNIQLGMYGVPLSTAYALVKDGARIRQAGLLQGFDAATWAVIALQVFGGLVTGMVVKYCDNILKNFALAVSVILTVLAAIPIFGQWPSPVFLVGVALVLLSVFMYGRALDSRRLQLAAQRALKRLLPSDAAGRRRRLLGVLLLGTGAAAAVLLLTGLLASSRRLGSGVTAAAGGLGGDQLSATEMQLRMAEVDRSEAGRRRSKQGLRRQVGQLLKESATQRQLIADGGRRRRRRRSSAS